MSEVYGGHRNGQLIQLAKPFPDKLIHKNPSGGGSYVKHHVVEQRLIQVLGFPPSFEKVEVIYGDVAEIKPNHQGKSQRAKEGRPALKGAIVGVIARMTATIDGKQISVEEAGDCEEPHNWSSDGQRLKDAMSDAYKRCAMRLGCGLHLWSQDEYFLHDVLTRDSKSQPEQSAPTSNGEAGGFAQADPSAGSVDEDVEVLAKSSPSEEPSAGKPPAPAAPRSVPEEVEGPGGEVGTPEASSGNLQKILNAVAKGDFKESRVIATTAKACVKVGYQHSEGLSFEILKDLPDNVLAEVVRSLKLAPKQEELV